MRRLAARTTGGRRFAGRLMILAMLCGVPATGLCFVEDDPFTTIIAPAIQKHCAKCHGTAAEVEADLNLATLRGGSLANNTELIRSLIDVLDLEEMPPEDEPQVDPQLRRNLVTELRKMLHASVSQQKKLLTRAHPADESFSVQQRRYGSVWLEQYRLYPAGANDAGAQRILQTPHGKDGRRGDCRQSATGEVSDD